MFSREIHPLVVRASTIVTDTYVAGNIVGEIGEYNAIGLEIAFTKGSLTSMEVKIEESYDGESYFQQASESSSEGTISDKLAVRQFTATGSYAILVTPIRTKFLKVSVKGTGTVVNSTVAIKAYKSWA